MREAPENPGGKATENQGLNVTQVARWKIHLWQKPLFGTCGATPVDEDLPAAERLQMAKSAPTTAQEGKPNLPLM